MTHALVLIAAKEREQARTIATTLVERQEAACVQMLPIESTYAWEGQVHHDDEVLLLVKTRADAFAAVERTVRSLHGYDVPEIVMVDITAGHAPYLTWIDRVVSAGLTDPMAQDDSAPSPR